MAIKVGDLLINATSQVIPSNSLVIVLEIEKSGSSFKPDILKVQGFDGRIYETGKDNLMEVTFLYHPKYEIVYLPSVSFKAITTKGRFGSSEIPVDTMFNPFTKRVDGSIHKVRVLPSSLVYIGEVKDLDGRDEYEKEEK